MFCLHYRYVVLLACFMVVFLTGGIGYGNVSIYHIFWMESFHAENARIAIIGSLSIGLCSMLGKLARTSTSFCTQSILVDVGYRR